MIKRLHRNIRGYIYLVRLLGVRDAIRYERDRRAGVTIDYSQILTANQRAVLGEHVCPLPWEKK